jgi:hypothetical protein
MNNQQTEELANKLEYAMSGLTQSGKAQIVAERLVNNAHRTNQQSIMRFCIAYIKAMADNRSDPRNQASVDLARTLVAVPEIEHALPYI